MRLREQGLICGFAGLWSEGRWCEVRAFPLGPTVN